MYEPYRYNHYNLPTTLGVTRRHFLPPTCSNLNHTKTRANKKGKKKVDKPQNQALVVIVNHSHGHFINNFAVTTHTCNHPINQLSKQAISFASKSFFESIQEGFPGCTRSQAPCWCKTSSFASYVILISFCTFGLFFFFFFSLC